MTKREIVNEMNGWHAALMDIKEGLKSRCDSVFIPVELVAVMDGIDRVAEQLEAELMAEEGE